MKIVFSHKIIKKERLSENDIKEILKNVAKGLFTLIKGENLPARSRLAKIYSTTIKGAKRIVILIETISGDSFLLFYRSKKDKIGENITIKNSEFKKALEKHLVLLEEDIRNNNYLIFEVR